MITAVAGMTADANILINYARQAAQQYLLTYNSDIPCEQLVRRLCDLKQGYTQHGGLRPFGVSFIYAGWDPQRQFQLYQSNPSGNYGGWKATSVGANNASAQSLLKQDYNEDCNLKQACEFGGQGAEQDHGLHKAFVREDRVRDSRQDQGGQGVPPPVDRRGDRRAA